MWSKEIKELRQALKDRIKAVYDSRNDWEHDRSTIEQRATMIFHMNEVMLYMNNEEVYLDDWILMYPDENPFDVMVQDCDDDELMEIYVSAFGNIWRKMFAHLSYADVFWEGSDDSIRGGFGTEDE